MLTLTTLCGFTFVGCDCNDEDALNNGGDPNTADVAPDSSSMQPDASPDLSTETDSGTTPGKTVQLKIHHNISGQSTPLANVRFVRSATQASPAQCASSSDRTDSEGGLDTQGATHISYFLLLW